MTAPEKAYARYMSEGESGWVVCYRDDNGFLERAKYECVEDALKFFRRRGLMIARNGVLMAWRKDVA